MSDQYCREVIRVGLAQVCKSVGWNHMQMSTMKILEDIFERYISNLGKCSKEWAEIANRTNPMITDIAMAFKENGISVPELTEFFKNTEPVPYPIKFVEFPVPAENKIIVPEYEFVPGEGSDEDDGEWKLKINPKDLGQVVPATNGNQDESPKLSASGTKPGTVFNSPDVTPKKHKIPDELSQTRYRPLSIQLADDGQIVSDFGISGSRACAGSGSFRTGIHEKKKEPKPMAPVMTLAPKGNKKPSKPSGTTGKSTGKSVGKSTKKAPVKRALPFSPDEKPGPAKSIKGPDKKKKKLDPKSLKPSMKMIIAKKKAPTTAAAANATALLPDLFSQQDVSATHSASTSSSKHSAKAPSTPGPAPDVPPPSSSKGKKSTSKAKAAYDNFLDSANSPASSFEAKSVVDKPHNQYSSVEVGGSQGLDTSGDRSGDKSSDYHMASPDVDDFDDYDNDDDQGGDLVIDAPAPLSVQDPGASYSETIDAVVRDYVRPPSPPAQESLSPEKVVPKKKKNQKDIIKALVAGSQMASIQLQSPPEPYTVPDEEEEPAYGLEPDTYSSPHGDLTISPDVSVTGSPVRSPAASPAPAVPAPVESESEEEDIDVGMMDDDSAEEPTVVRDDPGFAPSAGLDLPEDESKKAKKKKKKDKKEKKKKKNKDKDRERDKDKERTHHKESHKERHKEHKKKHKHKDKDGDSKVPTLKIRVGGEGSMVTAGAGDYDQPLDDSFMEDHGQLSMNEDPQMKGDHEEYYESDDIDIGDDEYEAINIDRSMTSDPSEVDLPTTQLPGPSSGAGPSKSDGMVFTETVSSQATAAMAAPVPEPAVAEDAWYCPVCKFADDGRGSMIGCDGPCEEWFHWVCVGVTEEPPEDTTWYCPTCSKQQKKKKSGKKGRRKKTGQV